ncbi:calcium/sodium antiporter [Caldilinea sp.]|jgi:cation:H+ antiporter|uniref:calcium/sodium antiporter n=1 Tax=Caldilinea sp. TaxID=2293560 RepID=UPI00262EB684|nr:calcium/sodium antiporter [uncultured Caldilinea sp.]
MAFILLLMIGGLITLVAGAELLVRGASRLAAALGVSPLIIGLTIVAFGTSSPELAVSVQSALSGQADVAVGNVVGSNIFNVLFILGLSALITPLVVAQQLVRIDVPLMIVVSLAVWLFALNGYVERWEGALLFAGIVAYTVFLGIQSQRERNAAVLAEYEAEYHPKRPHSWLQGLLDAGMAGVGLALLVLGARWFVDGAVGAAEAMGVSELVIGLTIVAAGTSLPEVATSIVAALRGERDIAVGNVVGSNIFNILAVLGLTALVAPDSGVPVSTNALWLDMPFMIVVAIACLPIFFTGYLIARWEGLLFLGYYIVYTAFLILGSIHYPHLVEYRNLFLLFAAPLTVITIGVSVARDLRQRREMRRSGMSR